MIRIALTYALTYALAHALAHSLAPINTALARDWPQAQPRHPDALAPAAPQTWV